MPIMLVYHYRRIKCFLENPLYRNLEVLWVLVYIAAILAEIPAGLSRFLTYFHYHIQIPEVLYSITAWDRSGHGLFYVILFAASWSNTNNRLPRVVQNIIDKNKS